MRDGTQTLSKYQRQAENAVDTENVESVIADTESKRQGPVAKVWNKVQWLMEYATDPMTPTVGKVLAVAALIYLISPIDAVPDLMPVVGLIDDVSVLIAAFAKLHLEAKERNQEEAALKLAKLQQEEDLKRKHRLRNVTVLIGASVLVAAAGVVAFAML